MVEMLTFQRILSWMWLELFVGFVRAQVTMQYLRNWAGKSLKSRRLAIKDKHFAKICTECAPEYLCELLPTTSDDHPQRSLRNENDPKEIKSRTETFRGSFIPDAAKRYNNNQKGSVKDDNNNKAVTMNRKLLNMVIEQQPLNMLS